MKLLKPVSKIIRNKPLNWDEALEKHKEQVDWKLGQHEDALMVFRDLVLKLHGENEELKKANKKLADQLAGKVENAVSSVMQSSKDYAELILGSESNGSHKSPLQKTDDLDITRQRMRTIQWMRGKYGLPPVGGKKKVRGK